MPNESVYPGRRALLVVDVQEAFVARKLHDKDRFLSTIRQAVELFRQAKDPIVFVRHDCAMSRRGSPEWELHSGLGRRAKDPIVDKTRGDAFEGTELARLLKRRRVARVLVCGLVSHGCVRLTCLGAIGQGFRAALLEGGHSNWARDAEERMRAAERGLAAAGIETIPLPRE